MHREMVQVGFDHTDFLRPSFYLVLIIKCDPVICSRSTRTVLPANERQVKLHTIYPKGVNYKSRALSRYFLRVCKALSGRPPPSHFFPECRPYFEKFYLKKRSFFALLPPLAKNMCVRPLHSHSRRAGPV